MSSANRSRRRSLYECTVKRNDELEGTGLEVQSRLSISPGCPLILPYHIALDNAREAKRGKAAIGTNW
jgi:adenylosuccinate synthase